MKYLQIKTFKKSIKTNPSPPPPQNQQQQPPTPTSFTVVFRLTTSFIVSHFFSSNLQVPVVTYLNTAVFSQCNHIKVPCADMRRGADKYSFFLSLSVLPHQPHDLCFTTDLGEMATLTKVHVINVKH